MLRFIEDAAWLTADRARAWCRVLAAMTLVAVLGWAGLSRGGLDVLGRPLGTDFLCFWTASVLVLQGMPEAAYDPVLHGQVQHAQLPLPPGDYFPFLYPPPFLLICAPLALLPYVPSLLAWLASGLAALLACLRRILPAPWGLMPMLAFPGILINAGNGQNGFVSAACLGGSMVLRDRYPVLSGACLGVLVYKPHLLLAAPPLLLAARRWHVIAGAVLSAGSVLLASWLILGGASWRGFLAMSGLARALLEDGLLDPWKVQSVFGAVRVLGGGVAWAYALHAAAAVAVLAVAVRTVLRRPGGLAEGALLATAGLLCSPYLLDYDLVCLALPVAWVAAEAQRTGWMPWEKSTLLAAYVLPLVARTLAHAGLPLSALVLAALLGVVARRAGRPTDLPARPLPQPA